MHWWGNFEQVIGESLKKIPSLVFSPCGKFCLSSHASYFALNWLQRMLLILAALSHA